MGQVQDLNLSGNQLGTIPPENGGLTSLVTLDLSDNQLTGLPDALLQLDHLTDLNLSGNQLGTIPPEIGGLTSLVILDLSDNRLTGLPSELRQLRQLDSLDLSSNQLTAEQVAGGSVSRSG